MSGGEKKVEKSDVEGGGRKEENVEVESHGQDEVNEAGGGGQRRDASGPAALAEETVRCQPQPPTSTSTASGEDLFVQARALPHQFIPDFDTDGPYLDLLGASAANGHAPAMTKLGEYAMRRAAWVEAYYWMKQAQRNGMLGLSPMLREIRRNWALAGFPDEEANVNQIFTVDAGSIGRALLHVDSGHEAASAREFLKEHYPAYL